MRLSNRCFCQRYCDALDSAKTLLPINKIKKKNYGQWPGRDIPIEDAVDPAALPEPELDEQLDWAPPELEDTVDSPPLTVTVPAESEFEWGAIVALLSIALGPELVAALEPVEQLPELPLTLD